MATPPGGHVFLWINLIWTILVPNYFEIGPAVFEKKIFKVFISVAMATRILHGMENFEQLWKGTIQKIIPVKFGWIWPNGLEDVI